MADSTTLNSNQIASQGFITDTSGNQYKLGSTEATNYLLGASKVNPVTDASKLGSSAYTVPSPVKSTTALNNLAALNNSSLGSATTPAQTGKTASVVSYRDNPDGTTTNTLSDGSSSTVRYIKNADGSYTPEEVAPNDRSALLSRYNDLTKKLDTKGARTLEIQQDEGVFTKKQAVTDLENKLRSTDLSYRRQIEDLQKNNPQGLFGGALESEANRLAGEGERRKADIAIQLEAANGNYKNAFDIATAKVNAEFEPLDNQIKSLQNLYTMLGNDLTDKEKLQLQDQIQAKQDERKFKYDLRLEQEKANIKATQEKASQGGPLQLAQQQGNVSNISTLLSDKNLTSAVGPNALSRFSLTNTFTGGKTNFVAGVEQLRSQLTLDSLINAKARGATFGALSEGELKTLSQSASKLGTWAIKDKDGNVTGYKANEKDFKAELDKINNFAKLDYILKKGNPDDVGVKKMPDGSYVTQNSDGTYTVLK